MINLHDAQTCSFIDLKSSNDFVCYPERDKDIKCQYRPSCCYSNLVHSNTNLQALFEVLQHLLKSDHFLLSLSKSTISFEQDPLQAYSSTNLQLWVLACLRIKAICCFKANRLILEFQNHLFYFYSCCRDSQCANWKLTD